MKTDELREKRRKRIEENEVVAHQNYKMNTSLMNYTTYIVQCDWCGGVAVLSSAR